MTEQELFAIIALSSISEGGNHLWNTSSICWTITEDTLLLSLLLDYMDGLSCRPEQVSREISENLLQRLGDSLEQDAGALRRLWQSYGVSGRSRAYMQ